MRRWCALALTLLVSVTACGLLGPQSAEIAEVPGDAPFNQPAGPAAVLGRGRTSAGAWEVVAYRSQDGSICTYLNEGHGGGGCGDVPAEGTIFGILGTGGDAIDGVVVDAIMSSEVRQVRVETTAGVMEVDPVSLESIGLELVGFAVRLAPGAKPTAVIALAADGSTLERFELLAGPDGGGGPLPTPAGP